MTNAEKFLINGVDKKEFAIAIAKRQVWWSSDAQEHFAGIVNDIIMFLDEEAKPTLTEDERVILRNIRNDDFGKYIGRGDSSRVSTPKYYNLYLRGNDESKAYAIGSIYNHLFQFIKERRRI